MRRTKEWWARLTPDERKELKLREGEKRRDGEWYCRYCGGEVRFYRGVVVPGYSGKSKSGKVWRWICPACLPHIQELIKKANQEITNDIAL